MAHQHILFGTPNGQGQLMCELPMQSGPPDEFLRIITLQPHLNSLTIDRRIHISVARLAVQWQNANSVAGRLALPTLIDLAVLVYSQKICGCTDALPRSCILRILETLLSWRLMIWPCIYILLAHQLEANLARMPNIDDMRAAIAARRPRSVNIEQYSQIPGLTPDDTCSLCCNNMTDFTLQGARRPRNIRRHYVLPCGHKFHYHEEFCIAGTIRKWFQDHNTCPVCRTVIA